MSGVDHPRPGGPRSYPVGPAHDPGGVGDGIGVPDAARFDPGFAAAPPAFRRSDWHAEHFQYFISGSGTAYLSEEPHAVRAGDTLYNDQHERHYFVNDGDDDLVFAEYFVPAECRTIWAQVALVCAWLPTGRNIDGGPPTRHIAAHSSAAETKPDGV